MKIRYEECPYCKEETKHRVRRRCFFSKGRRQAGTKYVVRHCCKCNKRRYK